MSTHAYRSSRGSVAIWRQASEPLAAAATLQQQRWGVRVRGGKVRTYRNPTALGLSHIFTDNAFDYLVRNKVLTDNPISYTVLNRIFTDNAISYAVRATVNTDYAISYSVRASVLTDYSFSYTIASSLTHVETDQTFNFTVRNGVVVDNPFAYTVQGHVTRSQVIAYLVDGGVAGRPSNIVYNIGAESRTVAVLSNTEQEYLPVTPGSVLDFKYDWTAWLAGANIATMAWSNGFYVTRSDEAESAGIVTLMVATAEAAPIGALTKVCCTITTDDTPPRTDRRTIRLKVADR